MLKMPSVARGLLSTAPTPASTDPAVAAYLGNYAALEDEFMRPLRDMSYGVYNFNIPAPPAPEAPKADAAAAQASSTGNSGIGDDGNRDGNRDDGGPYGSEGNPGVGGFTANQFGEQFYDNKLDGPFGSLLGVATPGLFGTVGLGVHNAIANANNIAWGDKKRNNLGMDDLSLGQKIGGVLGFNDYGKGKIGNAFYDGRNVTVDQRGMTGGFLGFGKSFAMTPHELETRRAAAEQWGGSTGPGGKYGGGIGVESIAHDTAPTTLAGLQAAISNNFGRGNGDGGRGASQNTAANRDVAQSRADRGYSGSSAADRQGRTDRDFGRDRDRGGDAGNGGNSGGNNGADSQGGGMGCFVAGTPILLADGTTKPIEAIRVSDEVAAFDGLGPLEPKPVVHLMRYENRPVLSLDGLKVTAEHPFLLADGSWKRAGEIGTGEQIVNADGSPHTVQSAEPTDEFATVYNFEVADLHTYVAGGFRVHNIKHEGGLIGRAPEPGQKRARVIPETLIEGEYVLPREVVMLLGTGLLDTLNSQLQQVAEHAGIDEDFDPQNGKPLNKRAKGLLGFNEKPKKRKGGLLS